MALSVKRDLTKIQNIRDIIENNKLSAHFQQIVSVSRKTVMGVEGLIRYVNPCTGETVSPGEIFEAANLERLSLEMDRACRDKILEEFKRVHRNNPDKLLFINMNLSILEYSVGSGYLLDQVLHNGINPRNVVIEISEINVLSNAVLKRFVDTYRQYGFMVALDDVGTGFSNMDRILLVRPDIIKIDISLVRNIHLDFYKQGVFKSLVILANKIGALVIAEGVEVEEEAIQVLRLGSHMIQGFHLSLPGEILDETALFCNQKIDTLSRRFNEYIKLQNIQKRNKNKALVRTVSRHVARLTECGYQDYDAALTGIVSGCDTMECAYVLDSAGIQISATICAEEQERSHENLIFYSAQMGTDHSMEKYYYPLADKRRKRCSTEPYVSLATGSLCITISTVFYNKDGERCILCADFKTSEDFYHIELGSIVNSNRNDAEMNGILTSLSEEIITDSLTGAYNRRYIEQKLPVDMYNAAEDDKPLSILLVDIDRFKGVNDRYGHVAGDQVLKEFVTTAQCCIRQQTAWVARYGGDEFLVVLSGADEATAARVAEAIRAACEKAVVCHDGKAMQFTVSIGIHTAHRLHMRVVELMELADRNLYTAKKYGRNQTVQELMSESLGMVQ